MRIAMLAHLHHPIVEPFAGGMETHTATVANELVLRGHDVTLFAKAGSVSLAHVRSILPAEFDYAAVRREQGVDACDEALNAAMSLAITSIMGGDFDLVFNNSLSPLPYTDLGDWPMVTILHAPPTLEKVNAVLTRPGWRAGSRHVFAGVSRVNAASWRPMLAQVQSVPNGIYLDQWSSQQEVSPGLAVWSARITAEKGLPLAIAAAREAEMRLEISGPIADEAYYAREIAPLLDDTIVYRGHLDHSQLPRQLARGQVFLSTSVWAEPFGLALVEAMACGTPVAALPSGAVAEVVGAHGGVIAGETTVSALVKAVQDARGLDRALVKASAQRFGVATMMERYLNLMDSVVGALDPVPTDHASRA